MFTPNSRYAKAGTYTVTTANGVFITVTRIPLPVPRIVAGWHRRADEYRLDIVAAHYLSDPTATWQLCETNNTIAPDALAARERIDIPEKGR